MVDNSRFSYYNPGEYLDRASLAVASTEVGSQVATRSDLEDLLPDYGERFMPEQGGVSGSRFLPFTSSTVTPRGCEYPTEDGIILNTIGLWEVSCMTSTIVSVTSFFNTYGWIRLELFDPEGTRVKRKEGGIYTTGLGTASNIVNLSMMVAVPEAGYRVRVYQWKDSVNTISSSSGESSSTLSAQYIYKG